MWQVSWLASCCLPSHLPKQTMVFVDNNKLCSLQLRVQLWYYTKFPFNVVLKKSETTTKNSNAKIVIFSQLKEKLFLFI
jgi:hypothetical protein